MDLAFLGAAALLALTAAVRWRVWFVPLLGVALFAANAVRFQLGGESYWVAVEMVAGSLRPDTLSAGRWWELIAYSWLHWDAAHLISNLRSILFTGVLVELAIGWRRTIVIWTSSVIVGGIGVVLFEATQPDFYGLGASAGAFALTGTLTVLLLGQRLDGLEPDLHVLWVVPGLIGSLLHSLAPDVSLAAHLGGLLVGLLAGGLLLRWGGRHTPSGRPVNWWMVAASPFLVGGVWCGWRFFYAGGLFFALAHLLSREGARPVEDGTWMRRAAPLCVVALLVAPAVSWSLSQPWKLVPGTEVTWVPIEGSAARLGVPDEAGVRGPLAPGAPVRWTAGGVRGEAELLPLEEGRWLDEVRKRVAVLEEHAPVGGEVEPSSARCVSVAFLTPATHRGRTRISVLEDHLLVQTVWFHEGPPQAVWDLVRRLDEHPCERRISDVDRREIALVAHAVGHLAQVQRLGLEADDDPALRAVVALMEIEKGWVVSAAGRFSELSWVDVPWQIRLDAAAAMAMDEGSTLSMPDVAHALASQLVVERPSDPAAWDVLAMADARKGEFEAAIEHEEKAIALAPDHWQAWPRTHRRDLFRYQQPWTRGDVVPPKPSWSLEFGGLRLGPSSP